MRDPLSWSIPIGRLFGITIKVHFVLLAVFLGVYLRVASDKEFPAGSGLDILLILGLLFLSVLLHELGHCYGAYLMDGEAQEVLLWPLGGLAYVDVPHTAWANFVSTIMGPCVNVVLCVGSGLALASASLVPPLNPISWDLFTTPMHNWTQNIGLGNPKYGALQPLEWWQVLAARMFFLNLVLFLFNVVILAYPMDGGRLLQQVLWPRLGYRRATLAAVFVGFVFTLGIGVVAIAFSKSGFDAALLMGLAIFIYTACKQQWLILETGGEDALFGYDFSQGYTSLERDQPTPAPRRKRPNFFKRWLDRRAKLKELRDKQRKGADDRRMDQLLEKIQREGRHSLTDEENRFLKRVADKYRNRP
jgi:stage IV sporulation protein FB